jgi:CheY-like chemotaxis protein
VHIEVEISQRRKRSRGGVVNLETFRSLIIMRPQYEGASEPTLNAMFSVCSALRRHFDRLRILVAEDESTLAEQLAGALTGAGYAVDVAADGEEADCLDQTETYDAVVLDLGLPRVDGLTVLRRWREAGLTMPVLVLTARLSWSEKVQGIDSGAEGAGRLRRPVKGRCGFHPGVTLLRAGECKCAQGV